MLIIEKQVTMKTSVKNNEQKILLKSIFIWILIIPLAILNGAFRDYITTPLIGDFLSRPLSGVILCILIFTVSIWLIPRIGRGSCRTYIKMGIMWLALTILFEFGMGFSTGKTFLEMLKAYDITSNNWWLIVVIFTGFTPYLVAKIKQII